MREGVRYTRSKSITQPWVDHPSLTPIKQKPPYLMAWGLMEIRSLTMTYFHTGIRTIIGAKAFHCPVRDGKEWYHLAMVIRHKREPRLDSTNQSEFIESAISVYF